MRRFLTILLLAATLASGGCSLSRERIRKADAVVTLTVDRQDACPSSDATRCAVPSPLIDAAIEANGASTVQRPVHVATLLEDGESAMAARISLIRAATKTIDVQTYIWEQDDAGKLVLDELVHAARRGVEVRILADQLFSFRDPGLLARLARASDHMQIRLYNPTFQSARTPPLEFAAGILCCFYKFNQRMHNKLIVVDDLIGITGGRNYEDRYFDWDGAFDYVDRDVMVGGPAARAMGASFDQFWNHKRSVPLTHLRDVNRELMADTDDPRHWDPPTYEHPERVNQMIADATDAGWIATRLQRATLRLNRVEYLSDLPGKTDEPKRREVRALTRHIIGLLRNAKSEIVLQTPYLVMSKPAQKVFSGLRKRPDPPRVVVSTNSLASTDAFAVYALSYKHRKRYLTDYGFEIYEMKPHPANGDPDALEGRSVSIETPPVAVAHQGSGGGRTRRSDRAAQAAAGTPSESSGFLAMGSRAGRGPRNRPAPLLTAGVRFGLHAKSIVVDDTFAMVGTHNFDPRSDHYNTESGVIVYDKRFADRLRDSILQDTQPENAWVIAPRQKTIPVLSSVNEFIGDVSERLPFFDLWPFRYATSYEIKPGCIPMRWTDPKFFECYEPVGDFPEVDVSLKLIYTRMITAFGSSAAGIL
ncbi:PLD-like domain-containing protein [Luteibacter sp. UNC138MFCol5.1]|uniref:phospholipase D family protein n=1 Tax=Luteibacter sp. UNC138MFCol5.1 TaxID=1502774 RepID=UPI0008BC7773|nr:phospholipase D family protein [Luteibacter sp. UNC138MFCol5.1]SEO31086.1 PLD-like domain-containing protein [Luteibacter sp. UNC138MFCol5.1]